MRKIGKFLRILNNMKMKLKLIIPLSLAKGRKKNSCVSAKSLQNSILSNYKLGHKWTVKENDASSRQTEKVLSEQTPQVLFIERCLSLLIPGGRLGIVVPESMFCNPSHRYVMNYIEQHARIDAIISMPKNLFQPYTHAKTCVIMMTKFSEQNVFTDPNHKIFMAVAKWCGHDSRGLEIPYDDIPLIQERYLQFKNGQELSYDHLGFTVMQSEIVNSNAV